MIKNLSLLIFCGLFLFQNPSYASDDQELTLIVGNTRGKGGLKESVALLVGQDTADFTHTKSFQGRVVSLDIDKLPQEENYEHLVLDFAKTTPSVIFEALGNTHPTRIFFEWFPSYVINEPGNNMTPLLLPALKNAFDTLGHKGEIIIEHMPHSIYLPDDYTEALGKLLKDVKCDLKYLQKLAITTDERTLSGIMSKRLQKIDPFSLHVNEGLHMEMRAYLLAKAKNQAPTSPQKYTDYGRIDEGVEIFAKILVLISQQWLG